MEAEFWQNKWASNQIGFHENATHPMLMAHWARLAIDVSSSVFVPLCGKSKDMLWLRALGHEIIGVELSEIAVEAFFSENEIEFHREQSGSFVRYRGAGFTLLAGDYFELRPADLGAAHAYYDRAALIALPAEMREKYVVHMRDLLPPGSRGLLIALEYAPELISPPPFIVTPLEVERLYNAWSQVRQLASASADVKGNPGTEHIFSITIP